VWLSNYQQLRIGRKTAHERAVSERQIDTTDRETDRLVYELYGLTSNEIKIVEDATQR
jgi:hypothetical protein